MKLSVNYARAGLAPAMAVVGCEGQTGLVAAVLRLETAGGWDARVRFQDSQSVGLGCGRRSLHNRVSAGQEQLRESGGVAGVLSGGSGAAVPRQALWQGALLVGLTC